MALTPQRRTSAAITELKARYGDAVGFLSKFTPDLQRRYCSDLRRVFTGTAPALATVGRAYGTASAESWVEIQLRDLAEFAGCREKMSVSQLSDAAAMILQDYGYMKVTELMLFFHRFKSGAYGRFYGSVDPMAILSGLREFAVERGRMIDRFAAEDYRRDHAKLFDSRAALQAYLKSRGLKPDTSLARKAAEDANNHHKSTKQ